MDLSVEKLELIKMLEKTQNPSVLKAVRMIFQKEEKDWYESLPNKAKDGIEAGLEDIENGRIVSYDQVKDKLGWR